MKIDWRRSFRVSNGGMAPLCRAIQSRLMRLLASATACMETIAPIQVGGFLVVSLLLLVNYVPLQQNADSIFLSIMSLQRLTVYFWIEGRFGSFASLLTAWVHNPLYNVYAQLALQFAAGLISPVFFCSLLFRRPMDAWCATLLTDALLLIVARIELMQHIFTQGNVYAVSLATAGLASLALQRPSSRLMTLVGTLGVVVVYVVNIAMTVIALPLAALFAILLPSARSARLLVVHALGAAVGFLLPGVFARGFHTDMSLVLSLNNVAHFAGVIWANAGWPFALGVVVPPVLALFHLMALRQFRILRIYGAAIVVMLIVTVLYLAVTASSRHVAANLFFIRYFVPGYLLLMSIGGLSLWLIVKVTWRQRATRSAVFVALATLLLLVGWERLRAEPAHNTDVLGGDVGETAREVAARYVSLSLDGIAGNYWYVWPAVLMAEQYRYDAGSAVPSVFGLAFRGRARREEFIARLLATGRMRVACIDLTPDECVAGIAAEMSLPGLRSSDLAPPEALSGGHRLSFAEVSPGPIPK